MKIFISTLFTKLYIPFLSTSLIDRAINNGIISVELLDMFSFVLPKKRIDSQVVGHGSGMLLGVDIIEEIYNNVVEKIKDKPFTIFFSPHGKKLNQNNIKKLFEKIANRSVLCFSGRYEGFDVRAEEEYADEVISIGDYVLCGGDLPVMVFLEAFLRLIPGVVGKVESVENDSFSGAFLDHPHYALPTIWKNKEIPEILKSGNHEKIRQWRLIESVKRTLNTNWQWLSKNLLKSEEKVIIKKYLPNHYCALLHNDIMLPGEIVGNSTVTSIDIHDIARSSATYGIKEYFIVTRLEAQQKLVEKFLKFWHEDKTRSINLSRAYALKNVSLKSELSDVICYIQNLENGLKPLLIGTSSRKNSNIKNMITYFDQEELWKLKRPILFVFGTSHGISQELLNTFDYRLMPIEGLNEFNFLSVRSAVGIIFDRWLGCNISNK